ncbi:MAG: hypothetical protein NTW49_08815 [Bacteroidia bacterium]|nr:hypothetical protein [Bacteroidia bacterium]
MEISIHINDFNVLQEYISQRIREVFSTDRFHWEEKKVTVEGGFIRLQAFNELYFVRSMTIEDTATIYSDNCITTYKKGDSELLSRDFTGNIDIETSNPDIAQEFIFIQVQPL